MKKRILALLLALVVAAGVICIPAMAAEDSETPVSEHANQVRVIVENTTWRADDETTWQGGGAPAWDGTLVDEWVDINDDSSIATCVIDALTRHNYTQDGAENNYTASIEGIGEFDNGWMSGWMVTLNDWFINAGICAFTVADGNLRAGDEIRFMYTSNGYGEDIGGSWYNNETTVKSVEFSAGVLNVPFDKDTHAYTLTLPIGTKKLTVRPTATNKNFKVATKSSADEQTVWYRSNDSITVADGTVLSVVCNDSTFASMNQGDTQTYTFTVRVLENVSSDWNNFRNSDVNMAITDALTPTSAQTTVLKWAAKLGSGWSAAPSVQIIVDDALIVMSGKTLYKLSLVDGKAVATGTMSAAPSYGYTPPIYADGMIICPLGGGTLEAFNAKTLESVWIYKDELGGQALSPIAYSDGCVYTGFWNSETKDANFVCVRVADGQKVWNRTVAGGFYWAGAVVVGNAVIVGTDDGQNQFKNDAHLLSLNKKTGEEISDLTLIGMGDQRSSIAYSAEKGRVYFTTKGGYLCSAALDAATGALSDLKSYSSGRQSTSTPVVYGDYVYFCLGSGVVAGSNGAGAFAIADADTLEVLYSVELTAYPQASALLSTAYYEKEHKLYFYTTYNGKPGGLSLIKVDPSNISDTGVELVQIYDAAGFEQYCIASPICDKDGTIYYKNDSGNVLAVAPNAAYLSGLSADTGRLFGEFKASSKTLEWIVPIGTTSVTFAPVACDGGSVTVDGGNTVALTDGTAQVNIVVTHGEAKREYTLSIREESSDNSISLKLNESNAYSGSPLTTAQKGSFYGTFTIGSGCNFVNLWPTATDANAIVKVFALTNVDNDDLDEIEITATNSNHDRYAIYFADDTKPMQIRIEVTAENGDVANYIVVMSKQDAADEAEAQFNAMANAVENAVARIDAIGTVDANSLMAILTAREAYSALDDMQKQMVSNYDVLVAAESAYAELLRGAAGITPQLRINAETNEWEVSYDNGATWTSLGVKATGAQGAQGEKGEQGSAGSNGTNGADGKDGVDGTNGTNGADGKDGTNGKDGVDGTNASNTLSVVTMLIAIVALLGNVALLLYIRKKK